MLRTSIIGLSIAACILCGVSLSVSSVDTVKLKINSKERITTKEESYYLIFTDNEVFKNEDSLLFMKFDSSDLYGKLKNGNEYECKVNWFRVPFLSMYRNIIECK